MSLWEAALERIRRWGAFEDLKPTLEKMLLGYLRRRNPLETFQAFTARHDLNTLQAIFSNHE
jgi:ferredoxin-nitrite reductase